MIVAYALLGVSILAEVIASACLTATEGFTKLKPSLISGIGYLISYGIFGIVLLQINLGVAYATWSAVGIIVKTLTGYFYYKQRLSKAGVVGLLMIMTGTITLNLFG